MYNTYSLFLKILSKESIDKKIHKIVEVLAKDKQRDRIEALFYIILNSHCNTEPEKLNKILELTEKELSLSELASKTSKKSSSKNSKKLSNNEEHLDCEKRRIAIINIIGLANVLRKKK